MSDVQDKNTDDSVEERVVQKLKKVITIKKELSEKQKAHIEKLGKQKKGTKYVKQIDANEVELPTEVVPKKPRRVKPVTECSEESSEPEVIVVKKKKKNKQIIVEETESEEEPEIVIKKKVVKKPVVKKPVVKKPVVKKPVAKKPVAKKAPEIEEQQFKSRFKKCLF